MKTQALSEREVLELLEEVPNDTVEAVLGEDITELTGAVKAAHGGELVVKYKPDSEH